jgi:hypothetical protein
MVTLKRSLLAFALAALALVLSGAYQAHRRAAFVAPGGPTFLIDENCEGTGTPSGWSNAVSPEWDYTTTVLAGSQSLFLNGADGDNVQFALPGGDQAEVWFKCRFRFAALGTLGSFIALQNSSFGNVLIVRQWLSGTMRVSCGSTATTTDAISSGATLFLWGHYLKGTGSNAVAEIWWNTTDTKPADASAKHAKITDGTATTDFHNLLLFTEDADISPILDNIQFAATAFE